MYVLNIFIHFLCLFAPRRTIETRGEFLSRRASLKCFLGSLMGRAAHLLEPLSNNDDDGSENVAKKMNLRSFKLNRVYLDPFNMSNAGDFS